MVFKYITSTHMVFCRLGDPKNVLFQEINWDSEFFQNLKTKATNSCKALLLKKLEINIKE